MIKIEHINVIRSKWKIVIENIYVTFIFIILTNTIDDISNTFKIGIILLLSNLYAELFIYFVIWKIYTKHIGKIFNEIEQFDEWKSKQHIFCLKDSINFSKYLIYVLTFLISVTDDNVFKTPMSKLLFFSYVFLVLMNLLYVVFACIYCKFFDSTFEVSIEMREIKYYSEEECCICLDKNIEMEWKILQCAHKFHSECIENWTNINNTCPICRC